MEKMPMKIKIKFGGEEKTGNNNEEMVEEEDQEIESGEGEEHKEFFNNLKKEIMSNPENAIAMIDEHLGLMGKEAEKVGGMKPSSPIKEGYEEKMQKILGSMK